MALLDVALAANSVQFVDATLPTQGLSDLISAGLLSNETVVFYGNGDSAPDPVTLGSAIGVEAIASTNIVATGGAAVTLDAGLLDVEVLTRQNLVIDGNSSITLNASALGVASGVTDLLNNTTIGFAGSGAGTFTYNRPTAGILSGITLTVQDIDPGDRIVIPIDGNGIGGAGILREAATPYSGGYLNLINGTINNRVNIRIAMTQEEYDLYVANKGTSLLGDSDTFVFPGTVDPTQPPYEACFCAGTMIRGTDGAVAVETLAAGDLVWTADHGMQPIRWIGSRKLTVLDLLVHPHLRPIRISAGALGDNTPSSDMMVSPQHRILVRSRIAQRMFGQAEVLVAAKQLLHIDGIDVVQDLMGVEYFHVLFDRHEVLESNGALSESLFPGHVALDGIGSAARDEVLALFPELAEGGATPQPGRLLLSGRQGRKMAVRHAQNARPLIEA